MGLTDVDRERAHMSFALGLTEVQANAYDFAQLKAMYDGFNNRLAVGEETISRDLVQNNTSALASGAIGLSYFTARKSEVSTQGLIRTGTTAAAATPTLCKFGVYSVAANGDLTLVAATANDTTLFATVSTAYTRSWAASFNKIAGQRYAFAQVVVSVAALPTFAGASTVRLNVSPIIACAVAAQNDLVASISAASISAASSRFYAEVLP